MSQTSSTHQFHFVGEGGEYFRIWIVNILLTIVTVGLYSAWAKVRRLRYFHGSTRLNDVPFQYTGEPMAILKGRLIVYGALGIYAMLGELVPLAQPVMILIFAGLVPWLIVKALRFAARNSQFLGLRFAFRGDYGEALRVFILWPILLIFTLGLIYPYIQARQKTFVVGNHQFGTAKFSLLATPRQFYAIYARVLLAFLLLFFVVGLIFGLMGGRVPKLAPGAGLMFGVIAGIGFYAAILVAFAYLRAKITNLVFNHTVLGAHRFESSLEFGPLLWIYLSNLVLIMVTLGLFMPWARVRAARYHADNTRLLLDGSLDDFVARETQSVAAAGGEFADALDIDLSL
ncbi:MAG: YjgN family protein [Burkholderiales bacterium]